MNWSLLLNSLLVSGLTVLFASVAGFLVALTSASLTGCWRRGMHLFIVLTLALPPFLVTNCWLDLLRVDTVWGAKVHIHSLAGAVWLLTSLLWPVNALFLLGAWNRIESSQLESEPALAGASLIRWLLWPIARGPAGQAALLIFVLALNNFTIPVLLQVRVFPEELWLALTTRLNEAGAFGAAIPLVLAPVLLLWVLRSGSVSWPRVAPPATARALRRQLGAPWFLGSAMVTILLLLLCLALPLSQVVLSRKAWAELPNLLRAAPDAIPNSFAFAAATASACLIFAVALRRLPLAWLLWILFFLPGILLGRAMIFLFGGSVLAGTMALALLAFILRYLALSWGMVVVIWRSLDHDLTDAARLDGASAWSMMRHVHWPQLGPQLAAAWYLTYLLCLWDVETLVLIYPPGGETLALRVFNLLHYGHNAQVDAMCVLLLGLAAGPWLLWNMLRWAGALRRPARRLPDSQGI